MIDEKELKLCNGENTHEDKEKTSNYLKTQWEE